MKKITLFLLLALLTQTITAQTQSCFEGVLEEAKTDYYNKNYFLALQKLNAIENACVNLETISKSQKLILDQWRDSIKIKIEIMISEINTEKSHVQTAVFEKAAAENNRKDYFGSWSFKDIESLDLSNSNLVYLPAEVSNCSMLKKINLIGNPNLDLDSVFAVIETLPLVTDIKISIDSLAQIPEKYRRWTTGIKLNTDSCTVFPLEILELENLNYLDVSGEIFNPNYFTVLPDELFQKTNLKHLILEYCKINEIPAAIGNLVNLVELKLSGNNLKTLPLEISKLHNLKVLGIENNFFDTLPLDVCKLLNLEVLSCYNNFLKLLPVEINQLVNLTALYLWNNKLEKIPDEICSLEKITDLRLYQNYIKEINPKISCMKNVKYLDIGNNNIETVPEEIQLLAQLEELYLDHNNIDMSITEISNMNKLKVLDLSNNLITYIPLNILKLENLEILKLDSNDISVVPVQINELKNIKEIYLKSNDIKELPEQITELTNLEYVFIDDNNINSENLNEIIQKLSNSNVLFSAENSEISTLNKNFKNSVNIEMVYIEGGSYKMGNANGESYEKPVHEVILNAFYMSKYEITNKQFVEFLQNYGQYYVKDGDYKGQIMIYESETGLKKNGNIWSYSSGYEDFPVSSVSWYGANEFCNWLSEDPEMIYTLSTEAQWEYAVKGGINAKENNDIDEWSGTIVEKELPQYAWFVGNSKNLTHKVGQKKPNQLGIYDMTGNVWEWCLDYYSNDYYSEINNINPVNLTPGTNRVIRGGAINMSAKSCRVDYRENWTPHKTDINFGFRIVCTEKK